MEVEKERMESTLELLSHKTDVAKEFAVTKQIYKDMICGHENGKNCYTILFMKE